MQLMQVQRNLKAFMLSSMQACQMSDLQDLQQQVQKNLQWLNQLVQVTVGALNPQKCCCLAYVWQPDAKGLLQLTLPAIASLTLSALDDPTL